jgi:hypothetical protein
MPYLLVHHKVEDYARWRPIYDEHTIKRSLRGRPRIRPDRVVGDKGYSSRRVRT